MRGERGGARDRGEKEIEFNDERRGKTRGKDEELKGGESARVRQRKRKRERERKRKRERERKTCGFGNFHSKLSDGSISWKRHDHPEGHH